MRPQKRTLNISRPRLDGSLANQQVKRGADLQQVFRQPGFACVHEHEPFEKFLDHSWRHIEPFRLDSQRQGGLGTTNLEAGHQSPDIILPAPAGREHLLDKQDRMDKRVDAGRPARGSQDSAQYHPGQDATSPQATAARDVVRQRTQLEAGAVPLLQLVRQGLVRG